MEVAAFHPPPRTEATRLCGPVPRFGHRLRDGVWRLGVTQHPALRSPDFPLPRCFGAATIWLTSRSDYIVSIAGSSRERTRARQCTASPTAHVLPRSVHAHRDPRRSRGLHARAHDQGRRGPDLPDRRVRVRQRAARRRPLRPEGPGQHLHADHESDRGRAREAHGRARGRYRRARARLRHGVDHVHDLHDRGGRRQHRVGVDALRRHVQPLRAHAAAARHRGALRRRRETGDLRLADRRAHEGGVLRVGRQSARQRDRRRRARRHRARARRAARRRQHGADALPLASVRARRRYRRACAHEVPGRSRQQHRGRDRRQRQIPVGRASRPLPPPERARRELSRGRVHRSARTRRLHRPGARRPASPPTR